MKLYITILFSFLSVIVVAQSDKNVVEMIQGKMIWSGEDNGKANYTVFRKTFDLNGFDAASIHIFADARYILWINGEEVLRGPCRFDPVSSSFDSMDVTSFLKKGKNAVVAMVMSHGSNSKMMDHHPGLTAGIKVFRQSDKVSEIWTDTTWKWKDHTRFLPPVQDWGVVCDRVDARIDDGDWSQPEYNDLHWKQAISVNGQLWGKLSPRTIPLLRETIMGGTVLNKNHLPVKLKAGQSVIIKANEMLQGFPVIQFESEEGVEIQFEFGYTGDSTTIGNTYGSACFYTARAGDQNYIPTDSYGFRYMKITVLNGSIYSPFNVLVKKIKLIDRRYPYLETGSFTCNDAFLNELWKRSALTARLNCEDAYLDCALREKAEWMGDAALIQYPLSRNIFAVSDSDGVHRSDHKLMVSMLRHIAQSQSDSGMFKAHHPSDRFDIHAYIEDYSCLWVQALRQVYQLTGNLGLVNELWEPLKKQLKWFEGHRSANGLVFAREFTFVDNPLTYCKCNGATLNAFVYKAFSDAAFLASVKGDIQAEKNFRKVSEEIKLSYNKYLWVPSKKTYSSGISEGKQMMPTTHAALMALNRGIVPENRKSQVQNYLFANYKNRFKTPSANGKIPDQFFDINLPVKGIDMPYATFWMLEELFKADKDTEALNYVRERWTHMMKDTVTGTLSEGFGGGDLCHNNGAIPAWFLTSKVLGVSEKLPVHSKMIEIKPQLGGLSSAEGTVVTVHGPVHVKWEKQNGDMAFSIDIPSGTQALVTLPVIKSGKKLLIDHKEVAFRTNKKLLTFTIKSNRSNGIYR